MLLLPLDSELTWAQVEANFSDVPAMVEQVIAATGMLMPDEFAEDVRLTMIETLLNQTATALNIPLHEIYPARHSIRWLTDTDGVFEVTYASLDGGPPKRITPCPQNQTHTPNAGR